MPDINWQMVAVHLAKGEGTYHLLTSRERDALEAAIALYDVDPNRREFGGTWVLGDALTLATGVPVDVLPCPKGCGAKFLSHPHDLTDPLKRHVDTCEGAQPVPDPRE